MSSVPGLVRLDMNKNENEIRDSLIRDILSDFHLVLCRIEDPAVAALILSGSEPGMVVMAFEDGIYAFRVDPGSCLEELLFASIGDDPVSHLREMKHSLQGRFYQTVESLRLTQRAVEAAAKLWRPVNVVVSGVRDGGGERR